MIFESWRFKRAEAPKVPRGLGASEKKPEETDRNLPIVNLPTGDLWGNSLRPGQLSPDEGGILSGGLSEHGREDLPPDSLLRDEENLLKRDKPLG